MTVVDLSCTYKGSEESHQLFDSVAERRLKEDAGALKLPALTPEKDRPKVKAVKLELRLG